MLKIRWLAVCVEILFDCFSDIYLWIRCCQIDNWYRFLTAFNSVGTTKIKEMSNVFCAVSVVWIIRDSGSDFFF